MADIRGMPIDGELYDGTEYSVWFATRTNGVFSAETSFSVTPVGGGMSVSVGGGICWHHLSEYSGMMGWSKEPVTLTLAVGDGTLHRIDAVVARYDITNRKEQIDVVQGVPGTSPAAPAPTRDESMHELVLCHILVEAGTTELSPSMVTDKRGDEAICGVMADGVTRIPTAALQAQYEDMLAKLQAEFLARIEEVDGELESAISGLRASYLEMLADLAESLASVLEGGLPHHAQTHAAGGTDPVTPEAIGAAARFETAAVFPVAWEGVSGDTGEVGPPFVQTVAAAGLLVGDKPHLSPVYSDDVDTAVAESAAWNCVSKSEAFDGALTLTCFKRAPQVALTLNVEVIR